MKNICPECESTNVANGKPKGFLVCKDCLTTWKGDE